MQVIWTKKKLLIDIRYSKLFDIFAIKSTDLLYPVHLVMSLIRRRVELDFDISRKYREIRYWWAICNKEIVQNRERTRALLHRSPSYDLVLAFAPFRKNGCLRRRSMEEKKAAVSSRRFSFAVLTQLRDAAKKGRKEEERWSQRFLPHGRQGCERQVQSFMFYCGPFQKSVWCQKCSSGFIHSNHSVKKRFRLHMTPPS